MEDKKNVEFLDLEFDSIGSWADEVDSDIRQEYKESEGESAESIKFNPKYAYQAQKVKESLPVTPSGQRENYRKRRESPPRSKHRSYSGHKEDDSRERYRNHGRGSGSRHGNGHDKFDRKSWSPVVRTDRDRGIISPLRSPLNDRPTRDDDRYNGRYRSQRQMDGHDRSRVLRGIDEDDRMKRMKRSPYSPSQSIVKEENGDENYEGGTPILSKWQLSDPFSARSRRRLSLPEGNQDEENEIDVDAVTEDDEEKLARREKDIVYGKNTESYKKYIEHIPRDLRDDDKKAHPRTPLKNRKCSRRSWDSQVRIWKRRIHTWASETGIIPSSQESGESVSTGSSNGGARWADVVAGYVPVIYPNGHAPGVAPNHSENASNSTDAATGGDCSILEEDESFLDDFELELESGSHEEKTNDSTGLDSNGVAENGSNGES